MALCVEAIRFECMFDWKCKLAVRESVSKSTFNSEPCSHLGWLSWLRAEFSFGFNPDIHRE